MGYDPNRALVLALDAIGAAALETCSWLTSGWEAASTPVLEIKILLIVGQEQILVSVFSGVLHVV